MSKKDYLPGLTQADNTISIDKISVRDNKGIVCKHLSTIYLFYPNFILTLSLFYSLVLITNNLYLKTINLSSLYPKDVRA